jgi:antibiotic biosynthesis monooxygenase (ABM) superfamily enzyme
MKLRDRLLLSVFVWLGVYPSVLICTWGLNQIEADLPLPVKVFFTTLITVPTIEFIVLARAKWLAARTEKLAGIKGELRDQVLSEDD